MEKLEKKRACAFLDETGENGGEEIFAQSYNQRAENNVQRFTFTMLVRATNAWVILLDASLSSSGIFQRDPCFIMKHSSLVRKYSPDNSTRKQETSLTRKRIFPDVGSRKRDQSRSFKKD